MKTSHFSRLGSPTDALYVMHDREGIILAFADICKTTLQLNGIEITPEIEQQILSYCREMQAENDREADAEGIPDKLKTLMNFTKKSKAAAHCRRIQLSDHELFLLAHNCSQIGFKHRFKSIEFVPQDANVLDSDIADMKQGNTRQFFKKIRRTTNERKRTMVHLFERNNEWHCFYFNYREMEYGNKSHWEEGSHLHYVSHLWPNYRKCQVWASLDQRNVQIQGVHIRLTAD